MVFQDRDLGLFSKRRFQSQSILNLINSLGARNLFTMFWGVENVGYLSSILGEIIFYAVPRIYLFI